MNLTKIAAATQQQKHRSRAIEYNPVVSFNQLIYKRDYVGALTLLDFWLQSGTVPEGLDVLVWYAYCYFHYGKYDVAQRLYEKAAQTSLYISQETTKLWIACCKLYKGLADEAIYEASALPYSPLRNRLLFHAASRILDESYIQTYHSYLHNIVPDYMALGAVHFMRGHFQLALYCYEEVLKQRQDAFAAHYYIALCYYKMYRYKDAQQAMEEYCGNCEHSFASLNLQAAIMLKYGNGAYAKATFRYVAIPQDSDALCVYEHNRSIYEGVNAAKHVFAAALGHVPEARQNLVRFFVEKGEYAKAYDAVATFYPTTAFEYSIKAAAAAFYAQHTGDTTIFCTVRDIYQIISQSEADKNAILGYKAEADVYFLKGDFKEACLRYEAIEYQFGLQDEAFELNYAVALAVYGSDIKAYDLLTRNRDSHFFTVVHKQWLARLMIRNQNTQAAFYLYDERDGDVSGQILLLRVIGNEAFAANEFDVVVQAADKLILLDSRGENASEYVYMRRSAEAALKLKHKNKVVHPPKLRTE